MTQVSIYDINGELILDTTIKINISICSQIYNDLCKFYKTQTLKFELFLQDINVSRYQTLQDFNNTAYRFTVVKLLKQLIYVNSQSATTVIDPESGKHIYSIHELLLCEKNNIAFTLYRKNINLIDKVSKLNIWNVTFNKKIYTIKFPYYVPHSNLIIKISPDINFCVLLNLVNNSLVLYKIHTDKVEEIHYIDIKSYFSINNLIITNTHLVYYESLNDYCHNTIISTTKYIYDFDNMIYTSNKDSLFPNYLIYNTYISYSPDNTKYIHFNRDNYSLYDTLSDDKLHYISIQNYSVNNININSLNSRCIWIHDYVLIPTMEFKKYILHNVTTNIVSIVQILFCARIKCLKDYIIKYCNDVIIVYDLNIWLNSLIQKKSDYDTLHIFTSTIK
jgi:hypothetical protein